MELRISGIQGSTLQSRSSPYVGYGAIGEFEASGDLYIAGTHIDTVGIAGIARS